MSDTALSDRPVIDDRLARRNAYVLAAAQAIGGALGPIVIGIGGLAGYYLLGEDKSLATLPVTAFIVGTATGTVPAALLMQRVGRRLGFQSGALCTMAGGALAAHAIVSDGFWLLCLATMLSGIGFAFVQQYRFAAADTASVAFRPKAISWVLAGGVVTGVVGPQVVIFTKDLLSPIPFAGAFLAQVGLGLLTIVILCFLRIPVPPRIARGAGGGRPFAQIVGQPRFIVAVLCGTITYALMSLVMTASPLAMIECDLTEAQAMLGIQWHVIAMFAPSFVTGTLIARYGKEPVIAAGLLLLVGGAVVALSGITLAHFWIALVFLGVGWNLGFIGATAMVTDTYFPEERARMQATNDFLIFGFQALASLGSGFVLAIWGWEAVNMIVFPLVAVALGALVWLRAMNLRETAI
jgi:MFS family permease